jgi:actin-related protein
LLFTDQVPFVSADQISNSSVLMEHESLTNLPLHKLVHESLAAVGDVDVRKDLAANIVLTGASSLLPNMEQRLSLETSRMTSSAYKCKVLASRHAVERSCAAWIGGSILSSLGSFQQLWLSRTEYEEYGATLAIQRFP